MSTMTMKELSKAMGEIDFAMLTTRTDGGQLATRPMSNNGEVEYDGDSFYFSWDSARTVNDIGRDPQVALSFQGSAGYSASRRCLSRSKERRESCATRTRSPSTGRPIWSVGFLRALTRRAW